MSQPPVPVDHAASAAHVAGDMMRVASALDVKGEHKNAAAAYRQAFLHDPSKPDALQRYCNLAGPDAPADMVAFLNDAKALPGLTAPVMSVILRFLVHYTETVGRLRNQRDLDFATDLADAGVCFAADDYAAWVTHARNWYGLKPHRYDAAKQFVLSSLDDERLAPIDINAINVSRQDPIDRLTESLELDPAFYAHLDQQPAQRILDLFPPAKILAETSRPFTRAIFVGCDAVYFEKYVVAMIGSLLPFANEIGLHVHVFDGDEQKLLGQFKAMTSHAHLNIRLSIERTNISPQDGPTYFHAVRFVRLMEFLPRYAQGLWQIDADWLFNRNPLPFFELIAGHDLALWLLPARVTEPNNRIMASAMGLLNTVPAQRYLKLVAGYLAHLWQHRRLRWGADQLAMWLTLTYLRSLGQTPHIAPADRRVYSGTAGTGVLWPGKLEAHDPAFPELQHRRSAAISRLGDGGQSD